MVCLGTNDVTRNRSDPDEVNINVTHAINYVKLAFPDVKKIGICSILPRKGKGQNITRLNETTKIVNSFILKMCKKDPVISLIDIHSTFCNQEGNANRSLFDNNDPSGVHINNEGVNKLIEQLYLYMASIEQVHVDVNCRTPSMRKRNLSSTTPQSSEKLGKLHKSGTPSGVV